MSVLTEQEILSRGGRKMSVQEVVASRLGNTWYYLRISDGFVLFVYYRDAKTMLAKRSGKTVEKLWWVEGDKTCGESVVDAQHICSRAYLYGGHIYYCIEGLRRCESIIRQVPGNPEGL